MSDSATSITIYTDGSCKPNPGAGGWAFITFLDGKEYHVSGGDNHTTNNRMELISVIEAIAFHPEHKELIIHSDSKWTINCAQRLWKRKKNLDLWEEYDRISKGKKITFVKVLAHSGIRYNEMVDRLAKTARDET
jgi:ribonuclease HI/DNA polymerase-3 subunit epsilon